MARSKLFCGSVVCAQVDQMVGESEAFLLGPSPRIRHPLHMSGLIPYSAETYQHACGCLGEREGLCFPGIPRNKVFGIPCHNVLLAETSELALSEDLCPPDLCLGYTVSKGSLNSLLYLSCVSFFCFPTKLETVYLSKPADSIYTISTTPSGVSLC